MSQSGFVVLVVMAVCIAAGIVWIVWVSARRGGVGSLAVPVLLQECTGEVVTDPEMPEWVASLLSVAPVHRKYGANLRVLNNVGYPMDIVVLGPISTPVTLVRIEFHGDLAKAFRRQIAITNSAQNLSKKGMVKCRTISAASGWDLDIVVWASHGDGDLRDGTELSDDTVRSMFQSGKAIGFECIELMPESMVLRFEGRRQRRLSKEALEDLVGVIARCGTVGEKLEIAGAEPGVG